MKRRLGLATAVVVVSVLATGCGGDDSEGKALPEVDSSDSPTSTSPGHDDGGDGGGKNTKPDETKPAPKPKGAKLTRPKRSVYEKAVEDHGKWTKIARRMKAHPVVNDRTYYLVQRRTEDPYSTDFFNEIRSFKKAGVRWTGQLQLHWRVPLDVRFGNPWPRVVWKECSGDGTLKVHKRGHLVKQKDQTPFATKVTMRLVNNGTWVPMKAEGAGTCGAAD